MENKPQEFKVKIAFNSSEPSLHFQEQPTDSRKDGDDLIGSFALSSRDQLTDSPPGPHNLEMTLAEPEYQYNYARIFAAASLLFVFFLVMAWGGVNLFSSKEIDVHLAETTSVETDPGETDPGETDPGETDLVDTDLVETIEPGIDPIKEEAISDSITAVFVENSVIQSLAPEEIQQGPIEEAITDSALSEKVNASELLPVSVTIYDVNKVGRAMLSTQLINKDPVGEVFSPIQLPGLNTIRLFFSTTLTQVYGAKYYHVWYRERSEVARIPLRVTSSSWRGNSGKYINHKVPGNWSVKLETADGSVLAEASFLVVI